MPSSGTIGLFASGIPAPDGERAKSWDRNYSINKLKTSKSENRLTCVNIGKINWRDMFKPM